MRRTIISIVALVAALLTAPAAASAHHLDNDTSKVACVLVGNVPKVQITAHYVDFSRWDQPVYRVTKIDDVIVTAWTGDIPIWNGPDYFDRPSITVAPGQHDVRYDATWNNGDNYGGLHRQVICPTPPPPPVTPPPPPKVVCGPGTTPMPTPTGVVCLVPKPKPCGCKPHPKPRPRPKPHRVSCKISYFNHDPLPGDTRPWAHTSSASGCRIRVVHPRITHGRQVFAVSCTTGRIVRGSARWYVGGKRVRNEHWTHTTHGGLHLGSFLFDQAVWGHWLWGRKTVRVSFRVVAARSTRSSWSGDDS